MRFLHVSDTHIGFAAYSRVGADGLNQRELDFFAAFDRAISLAIQEKVDFVFHTGDLFDSVRPTNRAISHVLAQAMRLHEARIPFVILSGNHEAPRLRETGAVLRLLDFIPGVHSVYKGATETVRIGKCAIHAVPHAANNEALLEQLRAVKRDPDATWTIAGLHAGVLGVGDFRTGEFHEQVVPQNELPQGLDYVAMGHYHRAVEVAPKCWYAGSTERCTFKEAGEEKSVNLVDLAKGSVEVRVLETCPMLDLPTLRCEGMPDADIPGALWWALTQHDVTDAVARLRVTGLPAHVYATLDHERIKTLTAGALHFELVPEIVRANAEGMASETLGALPDEFAAFLSRRSLSGGERDELQAMAKSLLEAAASGDA